MGENIRVVDLIFVRSVKTTKKSLNLKYDIVGQMNKEVKIKEAIKKEEADIVILQNLKPKSHYNALLFLKKNGFFSDDLIPGADEALIQMESRVIVRLNAEVPQLKQTNNQEVMEVIRERNYTTSTFI